MDTTNSQSGLRYESDEPTGDEKHALSAYVSDMLALERHISAPVARQKNQSETDRFGDARRLIDRIAAVSASHIDALEKRLEELGGNSATPLKTAWARVVGAGAATIDSTRKTKVSKNLRDDHTALSLASISYTMLYTTALGLHDTATANLAKRSLADIAPLIMEISQAIPTVVLEELQVDGENVKLDAADVVKREIDQIWREGSRAVHER